MTSRFIPSKPIQNASVKRPVSVRVFVWLAIFAVTGAIISCGFVISARQQFEAISLGYRGEELRQEEARLQEKLKSLQLKRDIITSPSRACLRAQHHRNRSPGRRESAGQSISRRGTAERGRR